MKLKTYILILYLFITTFNTFAQKKDIDKIIAIVGKNIILKSDIENQYYQLKNQPGTENIPDLRCYLFEEMLIQKLFLHKAELDSIEVTPQEVEDNIDRRIRYFVNQIGSEEKLEKYYHKSIEEIKDDFKDIIKEQMLAERAQSNLTKNIKVTPSEVKKFYNSLPKDSIPYVEAKYRVEQIVLKPKISNIEDSIAKAKITNFKKRIENGENFAALAVLYSEDPGSASKGGELGYVSRQDLVPEFAAVAFNLKNKGEVSRVVKTKFGYHIIQLIDRKGEKINIRHILITPKTSIEQIIKTKQRIDSISNLIKKDSISFEDAVQKFSDDKNSKQNNGLMINPVTNDANFEITHFNPKTAYVVNNLNLGEISDAFETTDDENHKVYKIIKLISKTQKHKANLKQDFNVIKELCLQNKKQEKTNKWIKQIKKTTYIKIDDSYKNCDFKHF